MNRLIGTDIKNKSGYVYSTSSNTYNARGQRVNRTEYSNITNYYYTGDALLYTTTPEGIMLTENILTPGGEMIASARFRSNDPDAPNNRDYYFYNKDIRGSTTSIIRPSDGQSVATYKYDAFGSVEASNSSFANEVTYTGSITDQSTGLQYMNARFYDPSTARFITQDTYTGSIYSPWTQHLYSYCGNNPVNFVDPTGHAMVKISPWMAPVYVPDKQGGSMGTAPTSNNATQGGSMGTAPVSNNAAQGGSMGTAPPPQGGSMGTAQPQASSALYDTPQAAAAGWGQEARPLTDQYNVEYSGFIIKAGSQYIVTKPLKGSHTNVVGAAFAGNIMNNFLEIHFVHTHPNCDCHTDSNTFSGDPEHPIQNMGDASVVEVFGYSSIFLVAPNGNLYQFTGGGTHNNMKGLKPVIANGVPISTIGHDINGVPYY